MKHISLRPDSWNSERRRYLLPFLLGFGTLLLVFLPVIIADGGYFIYYGDFNSQQIPFYNLANDAVRSCSFGWHWYTDLGANFIGSYAFYLFGSPFFWITTILPRSCEMSKSHPSAAKSGSSTTYTRFAPAAIIASNAA